MAKKVATVPCVALSLIRHDGEDYKKGESIELPELTAEKFAERGIVEISAAPAAAAAAAPAAKKADAENKAAEEKK